jgi:hypothetical protein
MMLTIAINGSERFTASHPFKEAFHRNAIGVRAVWFLCLAAHTPMALGLNVYS